MSGIDDVRAERLKKRAILLEAGMDPYPRRSKRTHTIEKALNSFQAIERENALITLSGRVLVVRGQGAILFADLDDGSGKIQAVLKSDTIAPSAFSLFNNAVDPGDFIEVSGTLFVTKRGERSIAVETWRMLAKSLLPLPDKYHGLQNDDERLRKRYLDLLTREELRTIFKRKEKFWDTVRHFMKTHGFIEVETPTLEVTTGGAEARPFTTWHNDFDMEVHLRISVGELWQKRLLAAGFEKTFEIGRTYRNEGSSPHHLQEFTNMEFYQSYANYEDGMRLVEELYRTIARNVYGKTAFEYAGHHFDLAKEWEHIDYAHEIEKQTGLHIHQATDAEIKTKLNELNVRYEGSNRERLTDTLWKYCRKNIAGPAFLIHHPRLISPLAKASEHDPERMERFQPIIAGTEVGNGYSELNDPLEQQKRFDFQQELLKNGDEEAMMPDQEFVEMLEHGMPPACGFGFGERLFSILEGRSIRETTLFPLTRKKTEKE